MMMVLRHIHVASYMHKASHSITDGTLALNFSPFQCHGSTVTGDIPPPVGIMLYPILHLNNSQIVVSAMLANCSIVGPLLTCHDILPFTTPPSFG